MKSRRVPTGKTPRLGTAKKSMSALAGRRQRERINIRTSFKMKNIIIDEKEKKEGETRREGRRRKEKQGDERRMRKAKTNKRKR